MEYLKAVSNETALGYYCLGVNNMCDNRYYDEIMRLEESEDIKRILKRWSNFSKNKPKFPQGTPVVLPDMLWVAKSGYGKTNLLRLLSEYLYEEKLMEFYGDVKFFEFDLEYCKKDNNFREFDRFNDVLLDAAGFRSEFKGVVCVDINEWIDHLEEKYFVNFMEYLSENSDAWHIIFVVDCHNEVKLKQLEAVLTIYFRIEKVIFNLPDSKQLGIYMEQYLKQHGFELEEEAKVILFETIEELRKGKYFDGYKTLNMICADFIYREFSSDNFEGYVITAETVKYYSKDSEFVERTKTNIEKRNKIGYLSRGEDNEKL